MPTRKIIVCIATMAFATGLWAQKTDESHYTSQYNKIYKAYLREPDDVDNLLNMAAFYADTANPMRDYPVAMRYASEAESLYVTILEDRDRYKEAKKLIKKKITVSMVRQAKQNVIVSARRELASDTPMSEQELDKYTEAFSNDQRTLRLVESKRLQSRYLQAQAANTLASYRAFIESYGSTHEGEEAATKMGTLAYSLVENATTEAEVDRRLSGYLDLEPVHNAAMRKKSALAYSALTDKPSPQAYRDYLKKYPGSDGYSTVLAKMDELTNKEFEHLHTARQYADFAINYPDNPLAEEAMTRLKKLILEKRDMNALKIYLEEFPLDISYNDIYLKVFNWHTEEGNLAPVELFAQRYPDFPYKMALQDALDAARRYDSIDIPRHFAEKDFSQWASRIYRLTGKKESFVALQRTLSAFIGSGQWKKALERIDYFSLSFDEICVDEVSELRSILEQPSDNRLKLSTIVRPAYDMMRPVLHPNGKELYFCRTVDGQTHIQIATPTPGKKGTVWRSSGDLVFNNIVNSDIELYSLFDGGNKMLFGNNGDIMVAERLSDGTWTVIETLPEPVNSPTAIDFDAYMLPDGSGILFASDRSGGQNLQPSFSFFHAGNAIAADIYFAPLSDGHWGNPVNLGITVNSPYMECSPVISDDLKTLYFVTDRSGLGFGDIYYTTRDNIDDWTSWSKPTNYGKNVNSAGNEKSISLASATNSLLINSNAEGRYACYSATLYHTINSDFTRVEIAAGDVGYTADIIEVSSRKSIGRPISVSRHSAWSGRFHSDQEYMVFAHQNGLYIPAMSFTPSQSKKVTPQAYSAAALLQMADKGEALSLIGLIFAEGGSSVVPCSSIELDHLADFLNRNQGIGAELSCHVEGSDDTYCYNLSQQRAMTVKQELVSRGVDPDRIVTSPYGNSQTKSGLAKTSILLTILRMD